MSQSRSLIICCVFALAVYSFFFINGVQGALTKSPQNVVVLRGQDAILNCSTDTVSANGQNPITWNYENSVLSRSPCTSQSPGFIASPPDSATDCNIRALASWQHGISGAYTCSDASVQAVATVIVLDPVCEVVQPVIQGRSATLMCRMTYDWQGPSRQFNAPPGLDVTLSWTDVSETTVTRSANPATFRETVETNMTTENVQSQTIPSHNCTIEFRFSPGNNRLNQYADNSVSSTCVTKPTRVWNCPSSVTVTPSSGPFNEGDVLTCTSDGYPQPSFQWTDSDGIIVSSTSTMTLTGGSFNLTCTATGNVSATCNASETVSVIVNRCPTRAEERKMLSEAVAVLAAITALLLFVVICLSVAIHHLRRDRRQHWSATKFLGNDNRTCEYIDLDQPVPITPMNTLPAPQQSVSNGYVQLNETCNDGPLKYAKLQSPVPLPDQSEKSTFDDYQEVSTSF